MAKSAQVHNMLPGLGQKLERTDTVAYAWLMSVVPPVEMRIPRLNVPLPARLHPSAMPFCGTAGKPVLPQLNREPCAFLHTSCAILFWLERQAHVFVTRAPGELIVIFHPHRFAHRPSGIPHHHNRTWTCCLYTGRDARAGAHPSARNLLNCCVSSGVCSTSCIARAASSMAMPL